MGNEEAETMRLARSLAVARKVMAMTADERTRALTFLAGMVPLSVEKAVAYVVDGVK